MEGPMRKLRLLLVLAGILGGGGYFLKNYRIEGLEQILLARRGAPSQASVNLMPPPAERQTGVIRVASFNIQVLGNSKLSQPRVASLLSEVIRRFDIVAVQEIRAKTSDVLPRLIEMINATGRHYDFVIGPRLGRTSSKEQYAFIYDSASIEVDRQNLYTVDDPTDRLHREPLVAWFRVRGPLNEQAFTFTCINIHTDPDETRTELDTLADVYRAVRDDGRREDDIILLGDLNVDDHHLGRLGQIPDILWILSGVPSNTRGDKLYDNMLFTKQATTEFTGRAGVFDLIREFNLTMDEALQVSDHMPIWAEFSVYEGGQAGRVATRPTEQQ
jgi:endonuclease/exonuclease/phosphatase family metal-dependent hydrolase